MEDTINKICAGEKVELDVNDIIKMMFYKVEKNTDYYDIAINSDNIVLVKMLLFTNHIVTASNLGLSLINFRYEIADMLMHRFYNEQHEEKPKIDIKLVGFCRDVKGLIVLEKYFPDMYNLEDDTSINNIYSAIFTKNVVKNICEMVKYIYNKLRGKLPKKISYSPLEMASKQYKIEALEYLYDKGYIISDEEIENYRKKYPSSFNPDKENPYSITNAQLKNILDVFIISKSSDYERLEIILNNMPVINFECAILIVDIGNVKLFEDNIHKISFFKYVDSTSSTILRFDGFGNFTNKPETFFTATSLFNYIIFKNKVDFIKAIIDNKIIVKPQSAKDDSMFYCIYKNNLDLFRKLIDIGYDINIIYNGEKYYEGYANTTFQTPITAALNMRKYAIVDYILRHALFDRSIDQNIYANYYIALVLNDETLVNTLVNNNIPIDAGIYWCRGDNRYFNDEFNRNIGVKSRISFENFGTVSDNIHKTILRSTNNFIVSERFIDFIIVCGKEELLDILIEEKQSNLNNIYRTYRGFFKEVLFTALKFNQKNMMTKLLRYGVDVNARDSNKRSVLIEAVREKKIEMISIILRYNPDLTIIDYQKKDVYHYIKKNSDIKTLIEEYAANLDAV